METMTKLEREQALKLIDLDYEIDRLLNRNHELNSENEQLRTEREKLRKELQSHSDMVIQQLRDELAAVKRERDEALAKVKELEHPRMVMRDNWQLWEVFRGDSDKPVAYDVQEWELDSEQWKQPEDELYSHRLYRRLLTADELRSWFPSEKQQPGEVLFSGELSFELDMLHRLGLGKVPLHTTVHTVITRKAGE